MRTVILLFCLVFQAISFAADLAPSHEPKFIHFKNRVKLGTVGLRATTDSPLAYQHFALGTAFLHAFMYELAIDQFRQAQALDPKFSMAYWGEAMANKHPLWNVENLGKARDALKRYHQNRGTRPITVTEQGYLDAVDALFGPSDIASRDLAYLDKMKALYIANPDDPNVAAFYALSIMGLVADKPELAGNTERMQQGRKLINQLFKKYPSHPGIVHYTMHYYDESGPELAKQGIKAAKIALDLMDSSSHVAHMSAHIYRRLGDWDAYNHANEVSIKAADSLCLQLAELDGSQEKLDKLYACNADNKYHSLEWLHYGYLQKGQTTKAKALLDRMAQVVKKDDSLPYLQWYYRMWARQRLAQKDWHAPSITVRPISQANDDLFWSAYSECGALLSQGLTAVHSNHTAKLAKTLKRFDEIITLTKKLDDPTINNVCRIHQLEVNAAQAWHRGDIAKGQTLMQKAINLQRATASTPLTPSLDFAPAQWFMANQLIRQDDPKALKQALNMFQELLVSNVNDLRAIDGIKAARAKLK